MGEELAPTGGSFLFWFYVVSSVHPSWTLVVLCHGSSQAVFYMLVSVMIMKETECMLFIGKCDDPLHCEGILRPGATSSF